MVHWNTADKGNKRHEDSYGCEGLWNVLQIVYYAEMEVPGNSM